ncbi:MAG: glycosyltransferase family 4 protein [Bacteroidota bacterium]
MKRLAIITTHPIQYNAPFFRRISESASLSVKVFYTWSQSREGKNYDPGFGMNVSWDVPLLEGYQYMFVENTSGNPGSHHHNGITNPTLVSEIEAWKADAVLVYGWNFKSHLQAIKYFKNKIPVFFRGDSHLLGEKNRLHSLIRRFFLKQIFKNIDYAVYVGTRNYEYFRAIGLKEKQLLFAPHCVNDFFFLSNHREKLIKAEALRKSIGITNDEIVFLFAGKLEDQKRPDLLLKAFIKARIKKSHLVFVGKGSLEDRLKLIAKNDANVHFLGFQNQSEMPVMYHLSDVFVLPSKGETWGLSINEAMICGNAIIANDKTGCSVDIVKNGVNGYVIESNNEAQLIKALHNFGSDKDSAKKFGQNSMQIIQDWSLAKSSYLFINAITKILAAKEIN